MTSSTALSMGRRRFLKLAASGIGAAGVATFASTACSSSDASSGEQAPQNFIMPTDPEIAATDARRHTTGRTTAVSLTAAAAAFDLGGRIAQSWGYGPTPVAPEIRAGAGDQIAAHVHSTIAEPTSIHWHGIRIRNDMDGVPPVTQQAIAPGGTFDYRFIAPDPGTYWYHSHSGLQADRGLFGPLIIEDPRDTSGVDTDVALVLDDWLDGLGTTPDAVMSALNPNLHGGMGGMDMGGGSGTMSMAPMTSAPMTSAPMTSAPMQPGAEGTAQQLISQGHGSSAVLGGMTQHIAYPLHLINGRPPNDPAVVEARAGSRIRLRVINAAAETPYRFAVAGHRMTIVAVDGYDVVPAETDAILIGMAQRYDVILTLRSGSWPVMAAVEGRSGYGAMVLKSNDALPVPPPAGNGRIAELDRQLVTEDLLRPADKVRLPQRHPDRDYHVDLLQAGDRYVWAMAGPDIGKLVMKPGERVRITMNNKSTMWHPMHTHGHTFAIGAYGGLRRDTVIVKPGKSLSVEFDADNPGKWMFHCHNAYHFEAGMTANLMYVR
ncbi:multicopper oxidase family protein [Gordonia sp. DT30]|uniref:multicopper oxidase family protein n=1 Tax=unclassified Gordonia (in: high G+C Gram-positive bacteria) TaxID=2657482 RepID=UPI003CFA54B5